MKKEILFVVICFLSSTGIKSQNIAAARAAAIGSTVTVRGIVTSGQELGFIRYLQDGTAGIAAYPGTGSAPGFTNVTAGDSVSITGPTKQYFNLLEIDPIQGFTIHASGKPLPAPNLITPVGLNETVEGTLIRINNAVFSTSGTFTSATSYTLTSASQTFIMRISGYSTNILGQPIPTGTIDVIGEASQFCTSPVTGCLTGYQLWPRTMADFILSPTGMNEAFKNPEITIYPNPANTKIEFKLNAGETIRAVRITDIHGREIYASDENINAVETDSFSSGIYYLIISSDNQNYHSKFIVQK